MFVLVEGDVVLYDAAGHPIASVQDGSDYRLASISKLQNTSGSPINPATQETLASIKDTDGIKKIVDALPAGVNEIGRVRSFLYDDVNNVAMPVAHDVAIPTNTRGLIVAGRTAEGKSVFLLAEGNGSLRVATTPPSPPPGTSEFVLSQNEANLVVGPVPSTEETVSSAIGNGVRLVLQFISAGAGGDPSEKGSKVEVYWREGTPTPTDHLIERLYLIGSTVAESLPDVSKTRDGTDMVGDGSNTFLVIKRTRLSTSASEIDAVVRGYTETA